MKWLDRLLAEGVKERHDKMSKKTRVETLARTNFGDKLLCD